CAVSAAAVWYYFVLPSHVRPFIVPPAAWTRAMCSALPTFREPWNITCSNRWAKPVLPSTSCLEPTSYQRLTATTGASRSTEMIRRRPFARRSSVNETVGWFDMRGHAPGLVAGDRLYAGRTDRSIEADRSPLAEALDTIAGHGYIPR